MKRIMTITTMAGLLVIAGSVCAYGRDHCCAGDGVRMERRHGMMDRDMGQPGKPGMRGMGKMHEDLQLTPEQQKKMETMREEFQLKMIDQRAALAKARIRVHRLMRSEASESELSRAIDELSAVRSDMVKSRLLHHRQMRTILTPEQREKMDSMRPGHGPGFGPLGDLDHPDDDMGPQEDEMEP